MQIFWHGGSTIELVEKKAKALLNPNPKADLKGIQVQVFDHTDPKHAATEGGLMFDWPGEYDGAGFTFRGIESQDKIIYTFHTREGNVAWMGELTEYPSDEVIESLGEVHVLILPVGDKGVLKAKEAYRLVEAVEPLVVIPICYGGDREGLSAFLKEMDVKMPAPQKSYELKRSAFGEGENMELVILE